MIKTNPSALLRQWQLGAPIASLCVNRLGNWVAAAIAGGFVGLALSEDAGEEPQLVDVGQTEIISLIPDSDQHAFLALCTDGKVLIVEPQIVVPTVLVNKKGITHIATSSKGHRAYVQGARVVFLDEEGKEEPLFWEAAGDITDLAFSFDANFLAASHEKGVTLFSLINKQQTELHSDVPCLNLIWDEKQVTAVREDKSFCVWSSEKLLSVINENIQIQPRSFGFTINPKYFVTSGARQGILFSLPFMAKTKFRFLGGADQRIVTCVAPHPYEPFVLLGYNDGMIVMAPLDGRIDIMVHAPTAPTGAGITGLVWNARGDSLLAAQESGWLMLFTQKSVMKAVQARLK